MGKRLLIMSGHLFGVFESERRTESIEIWIMTEVSVSRSMDK